MLTVTTVNGIRFNLLLLHTLSKRLRKLFYVTKQYNLVMAKMADVTVRSGIAPVKHHRLRDMHYPPRTGAEIGAATTKTAIGKAVITRVES